MSDPESAGISGGESDPFVIVDALEPQIEILRHQRCSFERRGTNTDDQKRHPAPIERFEQRALSGRQREVVHD